MLPGDHTVSDHGGADLSMPVSSWGEQVTLGLRRPFRAAGQHVCVELPGARALFTTRRGGVSCRPYDSLNLGLATTGATRGDDPRMVAVNRGLVAAQVADGARRFAHGRQVHGCHVARVTAIPPDGWRAPSRGAQAADGQATALTEVAAVVLVADCLPVAIAGEGAVAMIHAGWRGLAGGVLEAGVQALRALGALPPLVAAIGPGAGGCCYEVGPEVLAAFGDGDREPGARGRVDLKAIAAARLKAAGVGEVHDVGLCTLCSHPSLLFSHRREGGLTGRQAGIVWRS